MPTRTNRSRLKRATIKRKNGKTVVVHDDSLNDIRLDVLECVFRNPYITTLQVSQAIGRYEGAVRRILVFLNSTSVSFVEICPEDFDDPNPNRHLHWLITEKGIAHLLNAGRVSVGLRRPPAQPLKHEHMITHGMVHVEAGARLCESTTFNHWEKNRKRDFTPQETANSHSIAIPRSDEAKPSTATPDAFIFSIALTLPYEKERFIAFEADRGTKNRAQMIEQIQGWIDVIKNQTYRTHLGIKPGSFFILFLVRNHDQTDRIKWLQEIVLELTDYKTAKAFLFQHYDLRGELGYVVTRDCLRAGNDPLNLLK
jgi:hypothetical protein